MHLFTCPICEYGGMPQICCFLLNITPSIFMLLQRVGLILCTSVYCREYGSIPFSGFLYAYNFQTFKLSSNFATSGNGPSSPLVCSSTYRKITVLKIESITELRKIFDTVKPRLSQHPSIPTPIYCNLSLPFIAINFTFFSSSY